MCAKHKYVKAQGGKQHVSPRLTRLYKSRTRAKHVKWNPPKWLQMIGSRFTSLLLFQTAKNRRQRNCRANGY